MHLVALAWIYVVLMMALAEALSRRRHACSARSSPSCSTALLPLSIVLYVMAHADAPQRARRAPQRAAAPRQRRIQTAAASRPVTPSRRNEKNRDASSTVHQSPPLTRAHARRAPGGRAPAAAGWPASAARRPRGARHEALRVRAVRRLAEGLQHVGADLEAAAARCTAPSQAATSPRRAARRLAQRRAARPRPRRRPGRASRHARRPRRGRRARPAAPAGSRRPARCRRRRARRSTRHRPAAARPSAASARGHARPRVPCTWRSHTGCAPQARGEAAPVLGHRRAHRRRPAMPRFRLSQGAALTPPARVLISAPTRRRHRPVRPQQPAAQRGAAQNASGQASGRVFSKASSCMQASNTRITCGTWSSAALEALGIEDLRHQHAVGQRRRVAVAEARRLRRASCRSTASRPVSTQWRYQRFLSSSDTFSRLHQVAQHAQVVQRVDLAGDVQRQRAHARAAQRVGRQQRRLGMGLVEVLDDRQRLREHVLAVAQQRHQPRRPTARHRTRRTARSCARCTGL